MSSFLGRTFPTSPTPAIFRGAPHRPKPNGQLNFLSVNSTTSYPGDATWQGRFPLPLLRPPPTPLDLHPQLKTLTLPLIPSMAVAFHLKACGYDQRWSSAGGRWNFASRPGATLRVSSRSQAEKCPAARLFMNESRCAMPAPVQAVRTHLALMDERQMPYRQQASGAPTCVLAYDLVQGAHVGRNSMYKFDHPTAVLLHGILGCRKNWGSFARRLAEAFPTWQFLSVDLRCHGESTSLNKHGPHTVASAAFDVLKLVGQLRLTPRVLVGHSFGGKVALSMVEQAAKPLARPVRVWVLDATPGTVRPGGHAEDRPAELISLLRKMPNQFSSKKEVISALLADGLSSDIARWVVTNLRQSTHFGSSSSHFSWVFDLDGISDMYQSYEETNLWKIVEDVPQGVHINFLKAERSLHRWALEDLQRIHAAEELAAEEAAGVQMHVLEDAGHWVQADNPDGLFKILSSSFQSATIAN